MTLALPGSPAERVPAGGGPIRVATSDPVPAGLSSFRIKVSNTSRTAGGTVEVRADYTGVFDPAQNRGQGQARYGSSLVTVLLADGKYYVEDGDHYRNGRGDLVDALLLDGGQRRWGATNGATADSKIVLDSLRDRGTVHPAGHSGSEASRVDRYSFRYSLPGNGSVAAHTMTGSVAVHHDSGLLAEITQRTTVTGAHPEIADRTPLTFSTTITYSDYAVPVRVELPPASALVDDRPPPRD